MGNSCGFTSFLRCLLKFFNFLIAFLGVALLLYSLWILYKLPNCSRSDVVVSQRESESLSLKPESFLHLCNLFGNHPTKYNLTRELPFAWVDYFLLGLGAFVCLIALLGHIAAETSNHCCLSCYSFFVSLILLLQGVFVADVFFNQHWVEEIPTDPTGLIELIKQFVEENFDVLKWVGLAIVITEALAALLAISIRAITPHPHRIAYDSDDEYVLPRSSVRQPLLIKRQSGYRFQGDS